MDPDPEIPVGEQAPVPADPTEPTGKAEEQFPWATWGLVPVSVLAGLFIVFFLVLPLLAMAGSEESTDSSTGLEIVAQLVQQGLFFIAPPVIVALVTSGGLVSGLRALGFRSFKVGRAAAWSAGAFGAYLAFAIIYSTVIGRPEQEEIVDRFGDLGFQILLIVVLAPLAEEICFRGFIFGGLRKKMPMIPAALMVGVFFGLLHFSTGWSAVPVLIFLGVIFAVLYEKTESIWPPILLHAVNNGFALVVLSAS